MSRDECEFLINNKKCGANTMECDGPVCNYDGTPSAKFYYLSEYVETGFSCKTSSILIVAETESSRLFGTSCTAKDLICNLKKSAIIWNKEIIHRCEYELVSSFTNFSMVANNVIYQAERQWAFQLKDKLTVCYELIQNGLKIFSSTEGLFISISKEVQKLEHSETSLSSIHELILSEEDGHRFAEIVQFRQFSERLCEDTKRQLRLFANLNDEFDIIQISQKETAVLYSLNKQVYLPKCVRIFNIELRENKVDCFKYVPIRFPRPNGPIVEGFLTSLGVIRKKSPYRTCGENVIINVNGSNTVLLFDGKSAKISDKVKLIRIEDLAQLNSKVNFEHYKEIISEVDVFNIIHWDNSSREESNNESLYSETGINDFNINFKGTGIGAWFSSLKDEVVNTIVIIGSILVTLLVLTIVVCISLKYSRCNWCRNWCRNWCKKLCKKNETKGEQEEVVEEIELNTLRNDNNNASISKIEETSIVGAGLKKALLETFRSKQSIN